MAQTGIIRGTVNDATTTVPIAGVSVKIQGTNQGIATNESGAFEISKIEPGTYALHVSYLGYQELLVEGVKIEADKGLTLSLELHPGGEELAEVVVSVARLQNTNSAMISEVKSAFQVVSGISQQQIKLSQDRDAAQVMSRIPGLTIVENRFVMVRGIPERYNQVMLNNAIAPSTEVDKRTFSFDLIPSSVLERMMIYKSGAAENPGDFSGGLIKVYTNSAANERFTTFSLGSNIRANTTFNPYAFSRTSPTDFLGFDGGERALPNGFPTENIRPLPNSSPIRVEAPKLLNNNLSYESGTAIPDINFGIGLGRSWQVGAKRLSMLTLLNYSQSYQSYQRNFNRYLAQAPADYGTPAPLRFEFFDNRYEKENRVGVMSNWAYIMSPFHKIEFKNLYNQIGENLSILRSGEDFVQQQGQNRQNYMYQYRSRSIYSGQLEGTHRFQAGVSSLNWLIGANFLRENQPDLRRFRTTQLNAGSADYQIELPSSSNLFDTGRYFGELQEVGFSNGVNFERQLGGVATAPILLKAGYLADYRQRDFSARYFSYRAGPNLAIDELNRLVILPLDQVFANGNFGTDGFIMEEGTNRLDSYDASNLLTAGYVGAVVPLGRFNLSGGLRMEYNILRLNSFDAGDNPVNIDNPVFSPLGYLNVDYALNDIQKLRVAYGRSVNRPEFREIAPFLFYDFEFDLNRTGSPNLQTATIDNLDLRYELYPRMGETISFGTFYKHMRNPIETAVILQSEGQAFSLINADRAYSYGAELEVRKSFQGLTGSAFFDRLSVNLNASLIKSEVDYGGSINEEIQDSKRPLQGQSPYIANAVLSYQDEQRGWQVSAAYNVVGPRIYAIGNVDFPAIYELPRNAIDLTLNKNISKSVALKLGVQDLLNAPYRFYQDTNRDRKIDRVNDDPIFYFKRGTLFTTALTYTIK